MILWVYTMILLMKLRIMLTEMLKGMLTPPLKEAMEFPSFPYWVTLPVTLLVIYRVIEPPEHWFGACTVYSSPNYTYLEEANRRKG